MMEVEIPLIGGLYGFLIVILGNFIVMNLNLAVIIDIFAEFNEEEKRMSQEDDQYIDIIVPDSDFVLERYF
jgi:uncharacterized membrane protein